MLAGGNLRVVTSNRTGPRSLALSVYFFVFFWLFCFFFSPFFSHAYLEGSPVPSSVSDLAPIIISFFDVDVVSFVRRPRAFDPSALPRPPLPVWLLFCNLFDRFLTGYGPHVMRGFSHVAGHSAPGRCCLAAMSNSATPTLSSGILKGNNVLNCRQARNRLAVDNKNRASQQGKIADRGPASGKKMAHTHLLMPALQRLRRAFQKLKTGPPPGPRRG